MAPPARRPQPVAKESAASGPLHNLQTELLSAKAAWEQLGVRIAKGYTAAYIVHVATLEQMKKAKEAKEAARAALLNKYMFVFSVISIGFAGGAVGAVMGPWAKRAGEGTAHWVFREGARSAMQQGAKDIVKAGDEKLSERLRKSEALFGPSSPADDPYTTNSPKDIAVDEEIRDRIASAFGPLLEALDAMIDEANGKQADEASGQAILNSFRQNCPLMTDKPSQDDIPAEQVVSKASELAMWIAWANARDWDWWNGLYNRLDVIATRADRILRDGGSNREWNPDDIDLALEMDPIGDRLRVLGRWVECINSAVAWDDAQGLYVPSYKTYVDLRKLKVLKAQPTVPFKGMSGLSMQWDKTSPLQMVKFLSQFRDLKPIYK